MPLFLYAAGSNAHGQLSTGNTDDALYFSSCLFDCSDDIKDALPSGTQKVLKVACGANHTLLLLERVQNVNGVTGITRELWGCGDNRRGQLGLWENCPEKDHETQSWTKFRPIRLSLEEYGLSGYRIQTVTASWETSYVVLRKHTADAKSDVLISMGSNDYGDLGIGDHKNDNGRYWHLVDLSQIFSPPKDVKDLRIEDIVAGPHHVLVHLCATLTTGSTQRVLAGWGASRHSQLGSLIGSNGRPIPYVSIPHVVYTDTDWPISMAVGNQHSVLMNNSGGIRAFGSDKKGQLKAVKTLDSVKKVGCTWNGTYAVLDRDEELQIYATGSHSKGQLGRPNVTDNNPVEASFVQFPFALTSASDPGSDKHRVLELACGSEHVLCLLQVPSADSETYPFQTEVWSWGWNEHGNLATGTTQDVAIPIRIWPRSPEVGTSSASRSSSDDWNGTAVGVWGGCATSWVAVER